MNYPEDEIPVSLNLNGSSEQVQDFIKSLYSPYSTIEQSKDKMVLEIHCSELRQHKGWGCSRIMSQAKIKDSVGPHARITFNTIQVDDFVHVTAYQHWCFKIKDDREECQRKGRTEDINHKLNLIGVTYIQAQVEKKNNELKKQAMK